MKVIGYTRVSTQKQADEGGSLDVQRDKIELYCELHDHDLVEVYEDAGQSAKDMDRPALQEALDAVESGEAEAIVVHKLDRLTRCTEDLCRLMKRFKQKGVDFKSVQESLDTSTPAGRMVVKILGVVSEFDRETIAQRTSEALTEKSRNGEYVGGKPAFGYDVVDGELVEDPDEQEVLQAMLEYREAGLSLRKTAQRLADRGMYNRNGNKFGPKSISNIEKRETA